MAVMKPMCGMTPMTTAFRAIHFHGDHTSIIEDDSTPTNPPPSLRSDLDEHRGRYLQVQPRRLVLERSRDDSLDLGVTRTICHRGQDCNSSTPDFSCDSIDAYRGIVNSYTFLKFLIKLLYYINEKN